MGNAAVFGPVDEVLAGDATVAVLQTSAEDLFKCLPTESVQAVITDPPYFKQYAYLYNTCYEAAARVLVPHGDLLMILPHYACDPFNTMGSDAEPCMKYRWTLAMNQPDGAYARLCNAHHNLAVTWKPIGWWYKIGARPSNYSGVFDSYKNPPPDKKHPWQQSEAWAEFCLKHCYFTSGVVVDPMVGGGTLAKVALRMGWRVIAGDIDEHAIELTMASLLEDSDGSSPIPNASAVAVPDFDS